MLCNLNLTNCNNDVQRGLTANDYDVTTNDCCVTTLVRRIELDRQHGRGSRERLKVKKYNRLDEVWGNSTVVLRSFGLLSEQY